MSVPEQFILEKFSRLIEDNLNNPSFSLEDTYKVLGVSRSHLHRIIKEHTQLSTSLFVRKIKLKKAKELLVITDLRIAEIAELTGIDSPQNFSKYFVQEYNLSPTEFRKKKGDKSTENEEIIATPPPSIHQSKRRSFPNRNYLWGGLLLLILAVAGSGYYWKRTALQLSEKLDYSPAFGNSIAVLPFQSLDSNQTIAEGVTEEIHSSLSLLDNLKVIARASSNQYKNTDKTVWQIGDELRVAYVLRGKVREINARILINLELVSTKDDITVWSKKTEGDLQNIFNLLNDSIKEIIFKLNQKITPALSQQLERVPTRNLEAYNEFLLGRTLLITRTKEKLNESVIRFDKALALDPAFAEAQAYKSIAYLLMGNMGYQDLKMGLQLAEQHALKAIQLDAHNSTAYATLGNVYRGDFKWQQAKTAYEISLKYRPNDAQTIYWYSLLLRSIGQINEALRYSTKAVSLDPLYPVILSGHLWNCAYAGREDLAQKAIADGNLIFDDSFVYYMARGEYELYHNRYDKALKEFTKMEQLNPNMKYGNVSSAYCAAKLGNPLPTRLLLHQTGNQAQDYVSKSMLYAGLGQKDSSLICLEKAASMGRISSEILVTPYYRLIRQDPRFRAVLQQFDLPTTSLSVQ